MPLSLLFSEKRFALRCVRYILLQMTEASVTLRNISKLDLALIDTRVLFCCLSSFLCLLVPCFVTS